MEALNVQMLGGFSISTRTKQISDRDNRSRKMWILLAYLIYHRHRIILQEELIELLWGEDEQGANPVGALKTMFHRVRMMLDKLWGTTTEAGHRQHRCRSCALRHHRLRPQAQRPAHCYQPSQGPDGPGAQRQSDQFL